MFNLDRIINIITKKEKINISKKSLMAKTKMLSKITLIILTLGSSLCIMESLNSYWPKDSLLSIQTSIF